MPVNSDIQQQVFDLLSKASNLSFVRTDRSAARAVTGLVPGQQVLVDVLANLPHHRSRVSVGAEQFTMELPMKVRPGQRLEMTFVSSEPRATFAIARQGVPPPPVNLSDAARLLGLLAENGQSADPALRASLQSASSLLRQTAGESGVLASLMDEALTYASTGQPEGKPARENPSSRSMLPAGNQIRLATFEANASRILERIAHSSRSLLVEVNNQPVTPLPLAPGQVVDAAVQGRLSGNRIVVSVAGTPLEFAVPRNLQTGDIVRLTVVTTQPRLIFAIPRSTPDTAAGTLSEAGRWLSVLEHSQGGVSPQQLSVLERLNDILMSLPKDSPAFTAITGGATTYGPLLRGETAPSPETAAPPMLQQGNGILLNDDMAKLLQALIKGNRLALLEALKTPPYPMVLPPGQQLKGEVMASLGGGRFLVQVAGQALEFTLPKGISRGERLNLFFISERPQPTFLLARFGRFGEARVSETSTWLTGFLEDTATAPAEAPAALFKALMGSAPADAASAGESLRLRLKESGIFYESHLARWFSGDLSLDELLKEPQGRLSHLNRVAVAAQLPVPADNEPVREAARRMGTEVMEALVQRGAPGRLHEEHVDSRVAPLVREQLTMLQNGQIVFQGELFPGQRMEWAVRERESRRNNDGERERSWDTSLRLELPGLGGITARLILDHGRVSVDFGVDRSEAVRRLEQGKKGLTEQLQAAGLQTGEIGVRHETPQG